MRWATGEIQMVKDDEVERYSGGGTSGGNDGVGYGRSILGSIDCCGSSIGDGYGLGKLLHHGRDTAFLRRIV
jgi:hypothetical protein